MTIGPLSERGGRHLRHELLVDIPLDAAAAFVIDIGDAEDMRRLVPGGVHPLIVGSSVRPGMPSACTASACFGVKPALDPFETARLVAELASRARPD